MKRNAHAGEDYVPANPERIAIHIAELKQLFNRMDPSPFHERALDPDAEEFIVTWAEEVRRDTPLALVIHLDRGPAPANETALLRDAIRSHFARIADRCRHELRLLFRRGRVSLVIGLTFLASAIAAGDAIEQAMAGQPLGSVFRESLLIGGWVAMWRPLETFLYDWWPIVAKRRLYERLADVAIQIVFSEDGPSDAWARDWPTDTSRA
jgi:hypothetical protein